MTQPKTPHPISDSPGGGVRRTKPSSESCTLWSGHSWVKFNVACDTAGRAEALSEDVMTTPCAIAKIDG